MRYLGLDLGTKTLGLSLSDVTGTIASTYKVIRFNENDFDILLPQIKEIVLKEGVGELVLGLPKNMNNTIGDRALVTIEFKEKLTFNVIDDNGNNIECEILFTFESDETGKNYIVYTDNTTDEHGNTKVYASIFNPNEPDSKLTAIETEKEWKIIQTILEELQSAGKGE